MEVSKKIVTENAKTWSSAFIIIFKKEHQTDNWKKLMYKYEPVLRTFLTPNMWIFSHTYNRFSNSLDTIGCPTIQLNSDTN